MTLFRVSILTLVLGLVTGCGSDSNSNLLEDGDNFGNEPVVVTLGGFSSCKKVNGRWTPVGTDRWNKSVALSQSTTRSGETHWLRGCEDRSGNYYFTSSFIAPRVTKIRVTDLHVLKYNIFDVSKQNRRPLFIMGHSHGGWLALKLAEMMPDADIRGLVTVDPISYNDCRPEHYIAAIADPANTGNHLAGCQRAPRDINYAAISARLEGRSWKHYYQRNFLPLRSNRVTGPVQPHFSMDMSPFLSVSHGGAAATWNAHVGIDRLGSIWYSSELMIQREMGWMN